ncbi:hypothetical protein EJ08DRAFT_647328 [Tothia fuscella]|uniref:Uncharacterized protein n=1 Tax=Tothia fuscella TaxID=1048955 RepID=A0A9P4NXU6_9PEZI|nr:hypothetical protein EJ08DRAFT_647328 [Tothia fuscella]
MSTFASISTLKLAALIISTKSHGSYDVEYKLKDIHACFKRQNLRNDLIQSDGPSIQYIERAPKGPPTTWPSFG